MSGYSNGSQQLLLRLLDVLGEEPIISKPLTALVDSLGEPRDKVFRACQNLVDADWARQSDAGYVLTPKLTRISERMRLEIHRLHNMYLTLPEEED